MVTVDDLFPEQGKLILTGGGREFVEQLGIETVKQVTLEVLCGQNVQTQTEALTRRRIAIVTGTVITLFTRGWTDVENFTDRISDMALSQLRSTPRSNKAKETSSKWQDDRLSTPLTQTAA